MSTHPFEIQPVVVSEEDVVMTTWDDPDATFGVYERMEDGPAEWLADHLTVEGAERDIKFLLSRHGVWRPMQCTNLDCDGQDWEDHTHPPVGARVRIHDTGGYQGVGDMGNVLIESGEVGTVLDSDTDNHSAIVAIPGRALAWVPLIDLAPYIERSTDRA